MKSVIFLTALVVVNGSVITDSPAKDPSGSVNSFDDTAHVASETTVTWNELLANMLMTELKILVDPKDETNSKITPSKLISPLHNFFTNALFYYKKVIYDKVIGIYRIETTTSIPVTEFPLMPITPRVTKIEKPIILNTRVIHTEGPKSEVELVEPRYHGKLDASGDDAAESPCPEGSVLVDNECVPTARMVFAVPSHCPIGYKKDRLGFCRLVF